MAFNPNNYKVKEAKKLPVILLLDVSSSMSGEKIENLYDATVDMIETFADSQAREQIIDLAIITFGNSVTLHKKYTPVKEIQEEGLERFNASGMTPMGMALKMAKDMIEDKELTPSRIYRPAIILVSDGEPNDDWEVAMDNFIYEGRSSKCQRFAVAIGNRANRDVLERFTQDPNAVFFAENAKDISEQFKTISMSVSTRATSKNTNGIASLSKCFRASNSIQSIIENNSSDDDLC